MSLEYVIMELHISYHTLEHMNANKRWRNFLNSLVCAGKGARDTNLKRGKEKLRVTSDESNLEVKRKSILRLGTNCIFGS